MTLNDFKSIEGDKQFGINSLPVRLGEKLAAKVSCFTMIAPQTIVTFLLFSWQSNLLGFSLVTLIVLQLVLMSYFLKNPRQRALTYSAFGVPLLVTGMMVAASALRFVNVAKGIRFMTNHQSQGLSWFQIFRLGIVQLGIGGMVV